MQNQTQNSKEIFQRDQSNRSNQLISTQQKSVPAFQSDRFERIQQQQQFQKMDLQIQAQGNDPLQQSQQFIKLYQQSQTQKVREPLQQIQRNKRDQQSRQFQQSEEIQQLDRFVQTQHQNKRQQDLQKQQKKQYQNNQHQYQSNQKQQQKKQKKSQKKQYQKQKQCKQESQERQKESYKQEKYEQKQENIKEENQQQYNKYEKQSNMKQQKQQKQQKDSSTLQKQQKQQQQKQDKHQSRQKLQQVQINSYQQQKNKAENEIVVKKQQQQILKYNLQQKQQESKQHLNAQSMPKQIIQQCRQFYHDNQCFQSQSLNHEPDRNNNLNNQQKLCYQSIKSPTILLQQIKRLQQNLDLLKQSNNNEISNDEIKQYNSQQKEQQLNQKIQEIQIQLKQWQQQNNPDNNQFIREYQGLLSDAFRLKQIYFQYQQILNKSIEKQKQLSIEKLIEQLLKYLKIDPLSNKQYHLNLEEIAKKQKSNNAKINLMKKKNLKENQQKLQQCKEYDQKIQQLKRLINQITSINQNKPAIQSNTNQNNQTSSPSKSKIETNSKIKPKINYFITFFFEGKQLGKTIINYNQNIQQIFKSINVQLNRQKIRFYLKNGSEDKAQIIEKQLILSNIVLLQFRERSYICQIEQYIQVTLDNQDIKPFKKGTQLTQILKKLRIRGKQFYFFSNFKQYQSQTAEQDLMLKQCQICNVKYIGKIIRSALIPIRVATKQLIEYIEFNKVNVQKLQTAYISKVKIQGKQHLVNQEQTLYNALQRIKSQDKIQQILVQYKINLKIQLLTNNSRTINFEANSGRTIQKLKQQFQKQCNIDKKLQKWSFGGTQLDNQKSFEELGFLQCYLLIEVSQIKNLQYYGFSSQDIINTNIYTSFYIENDQQFQNQLEQSNFPDKQYQFGFRIKALAKIFTCIKKHCRIKTALDSIKSIVSKLKNRSELWMPPSSEQETMFNQNYVLFNILSSSSIDLIIEMCRTYKNHSPLPFKSRFLNRSLKDLSQAHYWICTKSINIVSLQIFTPVKGKSTFLNQMFNTDFETELRHPLCQKTVFIKYDIYRNFRYLIDLIDVSTDSMNQKQKIQLCKHSNILIIHLLDSQLEKTKKWVKDHCNNKPVIYIFRDSNLMKNGEQYKSQILSNDNSLSEKHFHLPQMTKKNVSFYVYRFCEISDYINKFIVQIYSKQSIQNRWLLNKYFQKNSKRLSEYTKKLRNLEKQFSSLVNLQHLSEQSQQHQLQIPQIILDLVSIQKLDDIPNFMAKMKEFSRVQRSKNLYQFQTSLQKLKNILEVKNDWKIQQKKEQIKKCFQTLQQIDDKKKTKKFIDGIDLFKKQYENLTYETLQDINKNYLRDQFNKVIQSKEFSIQNFWRILLHIHSKVKENKQNSKNQVSINSVIQSSIKIFAVQFQKGKTIQLINGDSLQMPIKLFRIHQQRMKGKNIMVIAIVGGQSSGKSTLLNFLFGCDFLSSEGRCTSGVYLTYYEVQGQSIPGCDGILVLDTEGLFSNYERKKSQGKNFDNKLVLFLLKTCDILIVNCRGDVSKQIQDILDLSFDSQLMKYEPGVKYPNFNIVLNMKTDTMTGQNRSQIQTLREKIVQTNQQMQKYLSSQESNSLPIAFGSKNSEGVSTYINTIQSTNKSATKQFYEETRKLSLNLVKIMGKRGKKFQSRSIADIYQEMYSTWSMLIRLPILTKHTNRRLKQFDDEVQKFICQLNQDLEEKSKQISNNIPDKILQIDNWKTIKEGENIDFRNAILIQFQKRFMNQNTQTDSLAIIAKRQIQVKFSTFETNLKLEITQKKYRLALSQSQNKGIDDLNKKARQLRKDKLSEEQKQKKFKQNWQRYTLDIQQKIDPVKNSKQIYHNVQLYYNDHAKKNSKINLHKCQYEKHKIQSFNNYFQNKIIQFQQRLIQINPLSQIQAQPVIAVSGEVTTDLKYQYFDMKKFFEPVPTRFNYYITYSNISQAVNIDAIKKNIQFQFKQSEIINNFCLMLQQDLRSFGVSVKKYELKNKLIDTFKQKMNGYYLTTQNINFPQWIIQSYNQSKLKQKIQKIVNEKDSKTQKTYQQKKDQYNKNSKNQQKNGKKKQDKNQKKQKKTHLEYQSQSKQEKAQFQRDQFQQTKYDFIKQEEELKLMKKSQIKQLYYKNKNYLQSKLGTNLFYNYVKLVKQIVKFILLKYINNNITLYEQTYYQIKSQCINKAFQDLKKIGIFLKQSNYKDYYYFIKIQESKFLPIEITQFTQVYDIINNMSSFIYANKLRQMISGHKGGGMTSKSQCIAYSYEKKIEIKENFKHNKTLSMYKDKQYSQLAKHIRNRDFMQLVKQNINFTRILNQIKNSIVKIPQQVKIQDYIQQISIVIKKQIQMFNKDLQQIAQILSVDFKYLLHDMTKKLIWKKLQIERIIQNKKIQQKLKKDQQQQKSIFFGILNTDSKPSCQSNAKIFIKSYKDFIEPYIKNEKQSFMKQKQQEFLKSYTRKSIQDHVDSQMIKCDDPEALFTYLKEPAATINDYYNKFVQKQINSFSSSFMCQSRTCINQFQAIINDMCERIKGTGDSWEVDILFEDIFVSQKQKNQLGAHLKDIFLELLMTGDKITSSYKSNKFKIKEGIQIQVINSLSHHINFDFSNNFPEFQIFNLAYFVQNVQAQFKELKQDISVISSFSHNQHDAFKQKIKLELCDRVCPCCDRLCDVDMRKDPHHTIHRIDSGHQMRAVKGMVVEKKVGNSLQKIASVLRCEDVDLKATFQYYGQDFIWENFVQKFKGQWTFKSNGITTLLFQHIWEKCGQKICEYHTNNGKQMKYIPYNEGTVAFVKSSTSKQQNLEYIFAIDGSGSMSGTPWNDQLQSLRNILNQIGRDSTNTVSILVFNDGCLPYCEHKDPTKIDVNQIPFPSGGTTPDPTFRKAAEIIRKINKTSLKSAFFFYISDGGADHPSGGIKQLLDVRKQLSKKNLTLTYTSILIGNCSYGKSSMQQINTLMGGRSQYVANAINLTQKIKEVLSK